MRKIESLEDARKEMQERRSKYAALTGTSPEDYDLEEFAEEDFASDD